MTFSKICLPTLESTADRGSSSRYTSALLYTARARLKKIRKPKLYTPSTLNIDLILWHTHLIVCAENVKSWFKSWVFPFTFQAYLYPAPYIELYVCFILEYTLLSRFTDFQADLTYYGTLCLHCFTYIIVVNWFNFWNGRFQETWIGFDHFYQFSADIDIII